MGQSRRRHGGPASAWGGSCARSITRASENPILQGTPKGLTGNSNDRDPDQMPRRRVCSWKRNTTAGIIAWKLFRVQRRRQMPKAVGVLRLHAFDSCDGRVEVRARDDDDDDGLCRYLSIKAMEEGLSLEVEDKGPLQERACATPCRAYIRACRMMSVLELQELIPAAQAPPHVHGAGSFND